MGSFFFVYITHPLMKGVDIMEDKYMSCLHFDDNYKDKICTFLDANNYEYTLSHLKYPCDKKKPWSIKMKDLTHEQYQKYTDFILSIDD
jgi:hypothetical protein